MKTYTQQDLRLILDQHSEWKTDSTKGERANLGGANLRGADLRGADLGGADLGGANLGGAYLGGANLGGAYLGGADLRGANLRGADLGGANLGGANLGGADLGGAYLRGAYLRGADLRGAYLGGAKGIQAFMLGKHYGFCFESKGIVYINIGCISKPIKDWMKEFRTIGKENGYTPNEIKVYGLMIKMLNAEKSRLFKKGVK